MLIWYTHSGLPHDATSVAACIIEYICVQSWYGICLMIVADS